MTTPRYTRWQYTVTEEFAGPFTMEALTILDPHPAMESGWYYSPAIAGGPVYEWIGPFASESDCLSDWQSEYDGDSYVAHMTVPEAI